MKTFNKLILFLLILVGIKSNAKTDTNIIYNDIVPDYIILTVGDIFKVDINEDGLDDISFYMFQTSFKLPYVNNLHSNANYSFFMPSDNDSLSTKSWLSGGHQHLTGSYDSSRIAVRLINGSDYYYGWIRVFFDKITPFEPRITIKEYAFCKIANYPFLFGQTTTLTAVNELNIDNNTQVYFNGSTANIVIQSDKQIKEVKLVNMLGANVVSYSNVNATNTNINTTNLAHGNYIVQVKFANSAVYAVQVAF